MKRYRRIPYHHFRISSEFSNRLYKVVLLLMFLCAFSLVSERQADAFPDGFFAQMNIESLQREIVEDIQPRQELQVTADSNRLMAIVGLEPFPSWQIYLIGGAADLYVPDFDRFRANAGFLYGAGMGWDSTASGSGGSQRWQAFGDGTVLTFTSNGNTLHGQENERIRWLEYTLRGGIILEMSGIEPFGGLKFSEVQGKDRLSETVTYTFESKRHVGVFGGLVFPILPVSSLTVELSAIDEMAIRVILCLTPPRFPSF